MDREPSATSASRIHPWTIGGILLLGAVLAAVARAELPYLAWISVIGNIFFAVALVVFAVGIKGQGRVANTRSASATLVALGVWTLGFQFAISMLPSTALMTTSGAPILGYVIALGQLVLAVVATVLVARHGELPDPWKWAPLAAVAAVAAAWTVGELAASIRPTSTDLIMTASAVRVLVSVGATLFVGALAIALGSWKATPRRADA